MESKPGGLLQRKQESTMSRQKASIDMVRWPEQERQIVPQTVRAQRHASRSDSRSPQAARSEEQDGAIEHVGTGSTDMYYGMQLTSQWRMGPGRTFAPSVYRGTLCTWHTTTWYVCFLLAASKYNGTENHHEALCPTSSPLEKNHFCGLPGHETSG